MGGRCEHTFRETGVQKFSKAIDRIKSLFDVPPLLEPAFAGVPVRCVQLPSCRDKRENLIYFDTGTFPKKGTPERMIEEWDREIEVFFPSEINAGTARKAKEYGKHVLTIDESQAAVERLRNAPGACHEHIAYEAAQMLNFPETKRYLLHIVAGASAEDYVFMPGETLKDIYFRPPDRHYKNREEYAAHLVPKSEQEHIGFLKRIFMFIARIWKRIIGNIEDDAINRPYMAHFYDPTRQYGERGLTIEAMNDKVVFQSAAYRIVRYWELAGKYYEIGKFGKAYTALGHMVHLISDLHVPAHVHNDIHGPTILLGKLDSFEQWCKEKNYDGSLEDVRPRDRMNIAIWNSRRLHPPVISDEEIWAPDNVKGKLLDLCKSIAIETQKYKSVDAPGTMPGQLITGKLTPDECYNQAKVLIPRAIENSAYLIAQFVLHHRKYTKPFEPVKPMQI
ncbi:MAG: hypothetical protein N3H30_01110 [Candidatus Micrarchaeota archaeon]|nr:hypothetical protein [Candidatus Micrarchaeota archaeon]